MITEKRAQALCIGDVLALPMGRTARVTSVNVGHRFTSYTTAEYGKSRAENTYPVMIENTQPKGTTMKHTLKADGAAFSEDGERFQLDTTGGNGHALCSCGATSGILKSRAARKLWHKGHAANPEAEAPAEATTPKKEKPVTTTKAKETEAPAEDREGWTLEFSELGKYYARSAGLHGAEAVGAVYGVEASLTGSTLTLYGAAEDVDTVIEKLVPLWAAAKVAHRAWRKADETYSAITKDRKDKDANATRFNLENAWFMQFMDGAADALAGKPKRKTGAYKDGVHAAQNPDEAPAAADDDDII